MVGGGGWTACFLTKEFMSPSVEVILLSSNTLINSLVFCTSYNSHVPFAVLPGPGSFVLTKRRSHSHVSEIAAQKVGLMRFLLRWRQIRRVD